MSNEEHMARLKAKKTMSEAMLDGLIAAQTLEFYLTKLDDKEERDQATEACRELVTVFNKVLSNLEVAA